MRPLRTRGMTIRVLAAACTAAVAVGALNGAALAARPSSSGGADQPLPLPVTHQTFNFYSGMGPVDGSGVGVSSFKNVTGTICSTTPSTDPNVNTDCEGTAPHNETAIAVDVENPDHLLASANDYQLRLSPGGTVYETVFSRARVSFDGGQTWTTYGVPFNSYVATGDPAVAFDANGTAYLSTLGFLFSQGRSPTGVNPDILVSHSTDGGKTWSSPSRVASGSSSFGSVGIFNDKPFMTAWGNGNAIITWTQFNDGIGGSYISSPIFASVTHDGGNTWTAPQEISGSASLCTGALGNGPTALRPGPGLDPGRGRRRQHLRRLRELRCGRDGPDRQRAVSTSSSRSTRRPAPASQVRTTSPCWPTAPTPIRPTSTAGKPIRTASSVPGRPATSQSTRPIRCTWP